MAEDLANELFDNMDFHYSNVKYYKFEQKLTKLDEMVSDEMI